LSRELSEKIRCDVQSVNQSLNQLRKDFETDIVSIHGSEKRERKKECGSLANRLNCHKTQTESDIVSVNQDIVKIREQLADPVAECKSDSSGK
jgi:signal transduction protein with GAF and PtsI domain